MADALLLQIGLCETGELVAARRADWDTQRGRHADLQEQLESENAENDRLRLKLAQVQARHATARLEALEQQRAIDRLRCEAPAAAAGSSGSSEDELPMLRLAHERRAADSRLAAMRAAREEERGRTAAFAAEMDEWVQGLGSAAAAIRADIAQMDARACALEEEARAEKLERIAALTQRLPQLEAERERLSADLQTARAVNARTAPEREAAAAAAALELGAAEEAAVVQRQRLFAAGRQQQANNARLKQLRRDLEQLQAQQQALALATGGSGQQCGNGGWRHA